jgi:hypothetical protein
MVRSRRPRNTTVREQLPRLFVSFYAETARFTSPLQRDRHIALALATSYVVLPRFSGGSASTPPFSGPAQRSLALRPGCLLSRLKRPQPSKASTGLLPFLLLRLERPLSGGFLGTVRNSVSNDVARPSWPWFFTGWKPVPQNSAQSRFLTRRKLKPFHGTLRNAAYPPNFGSGFPATSLLLGMGRRYGRIRSSVFGPMPWTRRRSS